VEVLIDSKSLSHLHWGIVFNLSQRRTLDVRALGGWFASFVALCASKGILEFWQWLIYREAIGVSTFLLGNTQAIGFLNIRELGTTKLHHLSVRKSGFSLLDSAETRKKPRVFEGSINRFLMLKDTNCSKELVRKKTPGCPMLTQPGSPYQRFEKAVRLEEATHVTQAGQFFFLYYIVYFIWLDYNDLNLSTSLERWPNILGYGLWIIHFFVPIKI
jgi:hypothetical protein